MLIIYQVTWVDLFAHWKYQYRPVRKVFHTLILILNNNLHLCSLYL